MVSKYFKADEIIAFLKKNKYNDYFQPISKLNTALTVNEVLQPYLLIEKDSRKVLLRIAPINDILDLTVCDSGKANQTTLTLLCYCLLNKISSIACFGTVVVQFERDSPQSEIPKEIRFFPKSHQGARPAIDDLMDLMRDSKFHEETKCNVIGFIPPPKTLPRLRNCDIYEIKDLKSILNVI